MNLRQFDLNLLVALDVLLTERNVTRAGERMLADGKSTAGIALELYISIETVRSHVKAIMRKLGVHSRVAAIARLEELRDSDGLELAA